MTLRLGVLLLLVLSNAIAFTLGFVSFGVLWLMYLP